MRLIAATTTAIGLSVTCRLDHRKYPVGRKVTDEELAMVNLKPQAFHGEWNYVEKGDAPVFMFCIRTGLSRCVSYPKKEGSKVVFLSRPAAHFPTLLMLNTLGRII